MGRFPAWVEAEGVVPDQMALDRRIAEAQQRPLMASRTPQAAIIAARRRAVRSPAAAARGLCCLETGPLAWGWTETGAGSVRSPVAADPAQRWMDA